LNEKKTKEKSTKDEKLGKLNTTSQSTSVILSAALMKMRAT
jgi:hypothetical protein